MFLRIRTIIAIFVLTNFIACSLTPQDKINSESTSLHPLDKQLFYGRSLLSGDLLKAYDLLSNELSEWEDNADIIGGIYHEKQVNVYGQNIKISPDDYKLILSYISRDNPSIYPFRISPRYSTTSNGFIDIARLRFLKSPTYQEYRKEMQLITKEANKILAKVTPTMNEFDKVRLAHDELLKLVSYKMSGFSADLRGAFLSFGVICDGYAQAFLYLLQRMGITGIYIIGDAGGILHAWNKVRIDGKWYNVDPTWDDSIVADDNVLYTYFLLSDANFTDHIQSHDKYSSYSIIPQSLENYPHGLK
ncbi:MAG: transglutaminase domain-containing protein [Brevinema sp.]